MPRRAGRTRQCGVERYSTPHCRVRPRCGAALTCAFGAFQAASALLWGSRAAAGSWALRLCGRWRRSRHACSASARAARWYATGRDRPVVPPPSYLRPHPHPSSLSVLCSRAPPRQPAHRQTDCVSVCRRVCLSVCLSVCVSVCLSIYLSVCLSVCSSHLLQQDHKPLRPADVRTARKGTLRRGRWLSRRDRADCKKEELEVPMGTTRLVPSTSTCCAPFWTRAHVL